MRITLIGVIALCLIAFLNQVVGQEKLIQETKSPETGEAATFDFWMNVKLIESQKLFAALAQADFPAISESGQRLQIVSKMEGFVRRKTPGYLTQLKTFEFSVGEILLQAEAKNIEGVTLGFQQLTLSCVHCHKQLRQ